MSWDDSDGEDMVATLDQEPVTNAWDDEDVEDSKLESWEDEGKSQAPKKVHQPNERKKKTQAQLRAEKSQKLAEQRAAASVDPEEVKRRAQEQEEASQLEAASDLFGGVDTAHKQVSAPKTADPLFADSDDEKAAPAVVVSPTDKLANMKPKTESEMNKFASLVAEQVLRHKNSFLYMHLIKQIVKKSTGDFKAEEFKELGSYVGVLTNDRLRKDKEADGKKKKKAATKKIDKKKLEADLITDQYDDYG